MGHAVDENPNLMWALSKSYYGALWSERTLPAVTSKIYCLLAQNDIPVLFRVHYFAIAILEFPRQTVLCYYTFSMIHTHREANT